MRNDNWHLYFAYGNETMRLKTAEELLRTEPTQRAAILASISEVIAQQFADSNPCHRNFPILAALEYLQPKSSLSVDDYIAWIRLYANCWLLSGEELIISLHYALNYPDNISPREILPEVPDTLFLNSTEAIAALNAFDSSAAIDLDYILELLDLVPPTAQSRFVHDNLDAIVQELHDQPFSISTLLKKVKTLFAPKAPGAHAYGLLEVLYKSLPNIHTEDLNILFAQAIAPSLQAIIAENATEEVSLLAPIAAQHLKILDSNSKIEQEHLDLIYKLVEIFLNREAMHDLFPITWPQAFKQLGFAIDPQLRQTIYETAAQHISDLPLHEGVAGTIFNHFHNSPSGLCIAQLELPEVNTTNHNNARAIINNASSLFFSRGANNNRAAETCQISYPLPHGRELSATDHNIAINSNGSTYLFAAVALFMLGLTLITSACMRQKVARPTRRATPGAPDHPHCVNM